MAKKLRDLVVKTGEYPDGQGGMKANWLNVGALMETDDGKRFLLLDRAFNPAGVMPTSPESRSIFVELMEPRQRTQQANAPAPQAPQAPSRQRFDDDIPF